MYYKKELCVIIRKMLLMNKIPVTIDRLVKILAFERSKQFLS